MKFFFKFLIIFYTIFTSNLYSSTSKIPNEKVFNNPKKEVTTVEAKKNKEHAEMNIKVNKLSIQEIKGYNIGEGKTQYFIPKEEKENKLLKNLTNNTENQYLIFETKEQLSDYLNKNKKAKNKRSVPQSIPFEVTQDENQTMLTVNSSAELYILENDNKIYKGSISTYKTINKYETREVWIVGYKDVLDKQFQDVYGSIGRYSKQWVNSIGGFQRRYIQNASGVIETSHYLWLSRAGEYTSKVRADYIKGENFFEGVNDRTHITWSNVIRVDDTWCFPYTSWPWETDITSSIDVQLYQRNYSYGYKGIIDTFDLQIVDYGNGDTNNLNIKVNVHLFIARSPREITININSSNLDSQRRLDIYDSKIQNELRHREITNVTPKFYKYIDGGISTDSTQRYLIFPPDLKPGKYKVYVDLYYNDRDLDKSDTIYINYDGAIIRGLDLTKAIPNKEYTINLSNGIGKTQEYTTNSSLDQNIHQISLGGNLDLSGVSKAELWVNGSNYGVNGSYNGSSYNVRLSGTNYLYITKNNYSSSSPYIELKLYDSSNNWKRTYRINVTNSTPMRNSSYTAEIDPRFFRAMKLKEEGKLYYNGHIRVYDYSALFNKTGGTSFSNIQSIASINNNYNLQNNSSLVTYNGYGFTKNQSPLNGYKDLNGLSLKSSKTPDTVNLLYLGNDNYYQSLNLSLTNNSRDMNKVYSGQGGINLKKANINTLYTFTKDNLNNNNGLTLNNSGEFITTGTSFDPNRDIVNKIIVNDNSTSHISGKRYNDNDIEITLGSNQISIKKLQEFTSLKSLKIDYYYNDLLLGTYTLRITNTEQTSDVIIEGIDKINFGTLIPEKTSSLQSNFTVKSLTGANITLQVPTESQMIQKGVTSKISNTIPLKIESTHQKNGNDINGWLRVSATPPKGTTPGEYEGTINLTVTIE